MGLDHLKVENTRKTLSPVFGFSYRAAFHYPKAYMLFCEPLIPEASHPVSIVTHHIWCAQVPQLTLKCAPNSNNIRLRQALKWESPLMRLKLHLTRGDKEAGRKLLTTLKSQWDEMSASTRHLGPLLNLSLSLSLSLSLGEFDLAQSVIHASYSPSLTSEEPLLADSEALHGLRISHPKEITKQLLL